LQSLKIWLSALAVAVTMTTGAASAEAKLKEDTFKAARAKYSLRGIENANNSTVFHVATAAPKRIKYHRTGASSFSYQEEWDFQKDGTNEKAFSCSIQATFRGDSTKVVITLKKTNNWCAGFLLKANFYPKDNKLVPAG
jgi:hypothetical protein